MLQEYKICTDGSIKLYDKEKIAIERIKMFEPLSMGISDNPYQVAYSGGKDSDVLRILFQLAGVKHDLVHHHTTVDMPEIVHYIRSIPNIIIEYPEYSMWQLIEKHCIPPTRLIRYCCEELKERNAKEKVVVTGVRWEESIKRKNRALMEIGFSNGKKLFNTDNSAKRKMYENCQYRGKRILNPIVDWSTEDVWEFLHYYDCESNPLYKLKNKKRIGCVGCPLSSRQAKELEEYPKYKLNYIKAFERMLDRRKGKGMTQLWKTGLEVYNWWIRKVKKDNILEGQIELDI